MPKYIYPPRPKQTIPPSQLPMMEAQGCWMWQPKYDGDRLIVIVENGKVYFANRHGKFHLPNKLRHFEREILNLNLPAGSTYLDGELLSTSKHIVFFDVLQFDGKYLIGKTQTERLTVLEDICKTAEELSEGGVARKISPQLSLSIVGYGDFKTNFNQLIQNPLVEGILLRKPKSTLDQWGLAEYEVGWQLRCRKNTKNYRF